MAAESGSAERRRELYQLLTDCIDEKCLRGGTTAALQKVRKACEIAQEMPEPWRQLAGYRYAHLMLRNGRCDEHLAEIDRHLQLAAGMAPGVSSTPLGPFPALFRLAVLHRMALRASLPAEALKNQAELRTTFDTAIRQVRDYRAQYPGQQHRNSDRCAWGVQDWTFNLLELAAYFCGEDYAPLEGLGQIDVLRPEFSRAWVLLDSDTATAHVLVTQEFAMAELKAREAHIGQALVFELPENGNNARLRLAGQQENVGNPDWVKLLAVLLANGPMESSDLCRYVVDEESQDPLAALRQVRHRLCDKIRKITRRRGLELLKSDGPRVRLKGNLVIIGAAHRHTLEKRWRSELVTPRSRRGR